MFRAPRLHLKEIGEENHMKEIHICAPHRSGWQLLLVTLLTILASSSAWASDWKLALKEALEGMYPITHRSALAPDRITNQGVVLVIQKQGIAADLSSDMRYSVTYVRDGQVGEQGGAVV